MEKNNRDSRKTAIIVAVIGATGAIVAALIGVFGPSIATRLNVEIDNKELEELRQVNDKLLEQVEELQENCDATEIEYQSSSQMNKELREQIEELQNRINNQSTYENDNYSDPQSDNVISGDNEKETSVPVLVDVAWKDKSYYTSFSGNGNNGFKMFGNTYTNGFTLSMGASYNMWGNGEQYVTFNIESISREYSTIKFLVGHIDDYESHDIKIEIFLDKTTDESADYTYFISPVKAPEEISIDIAGKQSMTIYVSNQGGGSNKIGFANPIFS